MSLEERRHSYRMANISKASCTLFDESSRFQGTLKNLSRTGFLFETDTQPSVARQYGIEIVLEGSHSRLVVDNLKGVVTRQGEDGVAVEFSEAFEWLVLVPIFYQENHHA